MRRRAGQARRTSASVVVRFNEMVGDTFAPTDLQLKDLGTGVLVTLSPGTVSYDAAGDFYQFS